MVDRSLDLLGESYESRDKPLDFQSTVNLYPEQANNRRGGLMSWPGKVSIIGACASDRGMYNFEGIYLQVCGGKLYKFDVVTKTRTEIGSINGTTRCTFASNAGVCVIANGSGQVYKYDKSTLIQITDSDLEYPYFVAHLNNQIIYSNDKTTGRWVVSDAGTFDSIDSSNYATAESNGDILIRPYVFKQQLLLFGTETIEPWWNSGNGSPPFDRLEGSIIEKGLGADYSIANSDEAAYFLGDDLNVYQILGGELNNLSTDGIWYQFSQYTQTDDAIGSVIKVGNQDIYILQFPFENVTWAFSQQKQFPFTLSSGTQGERYDLSSVINIDKKWYVSGFDGEIYRLDYNIFENDSETLVRERVTRDFDSEYFGQSDKIIYWNSIKMRCTVGKGKVGQDTTPFATLETSDDSGETWDQFYQFDLGELGEYKKTLQIHNLGSSERRKFRIRASDDAMFGLYELKADVELGI